MLLKPNKLLSYLFMPKKMHAVYPGFQQSASFNVTQIFAGDIYGAQTAVTLGANGAFALGTLTAGYAAFYSPNSTQVASSTSVAGTSVIAGIVLRNQGLSPLGWSDSQVGYGLSIGEGSQVSLGFSGKFGALITGVDTTGTANHVPVLGDIIWVSITDGSFASAPASVTTVTGYVIADGWRVFKTGLYNPFVTIGTNQTLGVIAGTLAGV